MMTPPYPIVTWQVTVASGAEDVYVTANGVDTGAGSGAVSMVPGDYWGFAQGASTPDSDSLIAVLATAIQTHPQVTTAVANYSTLGSWPSYPEHNIVITKAGDNAGDEIAWSSGSTTADTDTFGSDGNDDAIAGSTTVTWTAPFNAAGYWCPGQPGVLGANLDEQQLYIVYQSRTPHERATAGYSTRLYGSPTDVVMTYDYVPDEYLRTYRAESTDFAGRSGRDVADPNNLLENLLAAAAAGKTMRIYTAANTYRTVKFRIDGPFRLTDFVTPASNSGGWFAVTLPFEQVS